MSRFAGFQSDAGVAVLDTVTGELVFHPFDGSPARLLREAVGEARSALVLAPPEVPEHEERALRDGPSADPHAAFRPARRLGEPRPMVIRYPSEEEVAAFKAARLATGGGRDGSGEDGA